MSSYPKNPSAFVPNEALKTMSGLEFLRAVRDGEAPGAPIGRTLGYRLVSVEEGEAVFAATATGAVYNPIGSVHGGWYGVLLDSCMGCAVQTRLPAGRGYTTLEFKVNILRAATEDSGELRAEGRAVHVGRRTATAEGRMVDRDGRLYATGVTTCLVFDL